MVKTLLVLFSLIIILISSACSRSNSILEGRVETKIEKHVVVVTDCYRTTAPLPQKLADTNDGRSVYQFKPCQDADILIKGAELIVNGKAYGELKPEDEIVVDHGQVLINSKEAQVVAGK